MSIKNEKFVIEIDRDAKRLKRIFDDLTVHRECLIDSSDNDWHTPMKQYAGIVKKKSLIDSDFIEPMWVHKSSNVIEKRLIRLKPDTVVETIPGNSVVYYRFKRGRRLR